MSTEMPCSHSTARHPHASARYAPATGPIDGPQMTPAVKSARGVPRSAGLKTSETMPPPRTTGVLAPRPCRKRKATRAPMLGASAPPMMNASQKALEMWMQIVRP